MSETKAMQRIDVGQHVVFVDEHGHARDALVTAVWGRNEFGGVDGAGYPLTGPTINLVAIDPNEGASDTYGRQRDLWTSIVHQANTTAPGMYWRMP